MKKPVYARASVHVCVCGGGGGLASMQVDTSHKCGVYYKIETDIDKWV